MEMGLESTARWIGKRTGKSMEIRKDSSSERLEWTLEWKVDRKTSRVESGCNALES